MTTSSPGVTTTRRNWVYAPGSRRTPNAATAGAAASTPQLVSGHEMQAGVVRVFFVMLGELSVELSIKRVGVPGFAGRTRLRELGQPQVQALMGRVGTE